MEIQSPYSSQTIPDGIEEEEENDLAAAALHQARWKQLALAQAQAQMMAMNYDAAQHLKMNSVVRQTLTPPETSLPPEGSNNLLSPRSAEMSGASASSQLGEQLKVHPKLRQTLSAPGLTLSNGVAINQLPQSQELLQQQHLQFLKQQHQYQQNPVRFMQQLQQELLMQQIGTKNLQVNLQKLQEMQQQQLHKESQAALKEHLEQQMQQKEQLAWKEHLLQMQHQKQQNFQQSPQQQQQLQHLQLSQQRLVRVSK